MNFQPAAISGNLVSRAWSGDMIAPLSDGGQGTAASFVSKTFEHDGAKLPVELFISALGLYRCFINGVRVGDDLLTPAGPTTTIALPISDTTSRTCSSRASTASRSGLPTDGIGRL